MKMKEIWRDIKGYEGLYQVSNWGRVKSLPRKTTNGKMLRPAKHPSGYLLVGLSKDGKMKTIRVHRLVAEAFLPNPDNLPIVNHRDENKENNHVENLEWCDCKYSVDYGSRTERSAKAKSKPVYQFTLDGEFIREWSSATEIERQTGWSSGNICNCCNSVRYKSAYGYIWKYKQSI